MKKALEIIIYWWYFFTDPYFKEKQEWFHNIIKKIAPVVSHHFMTGIRGAIGIVQWFIPEEAIVVDIFLFAVGVISDFFDGPIARERKKASAFGDFWDGLNDKIFIINYCIKWIWRLKLGWEFNDLFYSMIALEVASYSFIGSKWLYFFLFKGEKKKDLFAHPNAGRLKCGMQCILGLLLCLKTYFLPDLKMLFLYSALIVCTWLTFLSAKEKIKKLFVGK
ncbi:MAG: CDP-alcohol phosphatidyltransferase family protein [Candidatus Moranbacteria bacterium]|nr:CDP-alcohol phosphatidyltransferase family protein [Candidatus Moranbacteria bacterium]